MDVAFPAGVREGYSDVIGADGIAIGGGQGCLAGAYGPDGAG